MIDPINEELLELALEAHLSELSMSDKRFMLMEVFEALKPLTAVTMETPEDQLAQVVYSAHLFTRIFKELYNTAEAQLDQADYLNRCLDK